MMTSSSQSPFSVAETGQSVRFLLPFKPLSPSPHGYGRPAYSVLGYGLNDVHCIMMARLNTHISMKNKSDPSYTFFFIKNLPFQEIPSLHFVSSRILQSSSFSGRLLDKVSDYLQCGDAVSKGLHLYILDSQGARVLLPANNVVDVDMGSTVLLCAEGEAVTDAWQKWLLT